MDKPAATRNPLEWGVGRMPALQVPASAVERSSDAVPAPRRIGLSDLRAALDAGLRDLSASRTDVIFLCIIYPLAGVIFYKLVLGYGLLELMFPLVAGFALLGPLLATGLYEMSRQMERGVRVNWATAFGAFQSAAIGSIIGLGVVLMVLFVGWLGAAELIYRATIGLEHPDGWSAFAQDVVSTPGGHMLIAVGIAVGFVFAAIVLCISAISFPLLLDRNVTVAAAVRASVRTAQENPGAMAAWGLIVAGGLLLGTACALIGLALVVPVLGHATWHLYRRVMPA